MTDKTHAKRLEDKYRILAAELGSHKDHRAFDFFARVARNEVAAEAASIFIYDPVGDKVWLKASTDLAERDIEVPKEGSFVGTVIKTKRRLVVEDAAHVENVHKKIDAKTGFVTRNLACVPVYSVKGDEVVGAVEALNKTGGAKFSDGDVQFLEDVAYMVQVQANRAFLTQRLVEAVDAAETRVKKTVQMAIAAVIVIPPVLLMGLLVVLFALKLIH